MRSTSLWGCGAWLTGQPLQDHRRRSQASAPCGAETSRGRTAEDRRKAPLRRSSHGSGRPPGTTHEGNRLMTVTTESPATNGVDTATLFATLDAVKGQNEIAKFQFRASNTWVSGTHSRSHVLRLLRRHAGDGAQARDRGRRRPPGGPRRRRTTARPRSSTCCTRIAACLTAGIANIAAARGVDAHRGQLDRRGRHRPARHPRPVRRLGPQRLRADPGHLPHRGRRRRRDPARRSSSSPAAARPSTTCSPTRPPSSIDVVTG